MTVIITAPGSYFDLAEEDYHADPVPCGSLSSSGARKLLPPGCPAVYREHQQHPPPPQKELEIGAAAHAKVLGSGAPHQVVCDAEGEPYEKWQSRAAKDAVAAVRKAGRIPVHPPEAALIDAMAEALLRDPDARALLEAPGHTEVSLFDVQPHMEVWKRGRLDYLSDPYPDGLIVVGDYKTAARIDQYSIEKAMFDRGYFMQAPWYLDLAAAVAPGAAPGVAVVFAFIFQMKDPPYLCTVAQPRPEVVEWGRARNWRALQVYRRCVQRDDWPGYTDHIVQVGLPRWAEYQLQDESAAYYPGED